MDNSQYTPSELIDLALDCELDHNQATSLFEQLSHDSSLQEEFRQAVAIRRALLNDVLASIPSIEFTNNLFQRAGIEVPVDAYPPNVTQSGINWASLATTAVVFLGVGIFAMFGLSKFYGNHEEIHKGFSINLPKIYELKIAQETISASNNDGQLLKNSENTLSPFHTPTYHHKQKASKGTADSITIMSENDRAELSVGLSSVVSNTSKGLQQQLQRKTSVLLETSFLRYIGMNFLYIDKKSFQPENPERQLLTPAIDYNHIRGNSALAKYARLESEVATPVGIRNKAVSDSKYALEFNGISDHIVIDNIPKSIGVTSTTTAWIYKITEAVNQQWIVGMGARQSLVVQKDGRVAMTNYLASGRPENKLDTGYWCSVADPEKVQLNTWVHYAGVVETDSRQTTLKLYRDGKLVNQQSFDYTVNGNPGCDGFIGGVHIGFKSPECFFTYSQSFIGQIDEISMWNRALTQADIVDIMHRKLNINEDGLIGYWPFEEGSGVLSEDKSKYSNHASLSLGASWVKLR